MDLDNSKLFGSSILNNTFGNETIQPNDMAITNLEQRRLQSHAMFSDLQKNQFQKCEEDYIKNQHMLRNFYDQETSDSKSNVTGENDLTFGLMFSPHDGQQFSRSSDRNTSSHDEIFVFSVRNIEKIAQFLNLNYNKLKDLFIKIINDEEVNPELLVDLNLKMSTDQNETHCEEIENQVSECKSLVFDQSTQTNPETTQVHSSNKFNIAQIIDDAIQLKPPSSTQVNRSQTVKTLNELISDTKDIQYKGIFDQFIQPLDESIQENNTTVHEHNVSSNLSQDPRNMSTQLLSIVDVMLQKIKSDNNSCVQSRNTDSPDLFSDCSDDDCIPQS